MTRELLASRLSGLQTGNPRRLRMVASWETPGSNSIELEVHAHFYSLRGSGEWFALPREFLTECPDLGLGDSVFQFLRQWPTARIRALAPGGHTSSEELARLFADPVETSAQLRAECEWSGGKAA